MPKDKEFTTIYLEDDLPHHKKMRDDVAANPKKYQCIGQTCTGKEYRIKE